MKFLTDKVEKIIKSAFLEQVSTIFYGNNTAEDHCVGAFGTFPATSEKVYAEVFLATYPIEEDSKQDAGEDIYFVQFVLSVSRKDIPNVVALVGDK